MGYRNLVLDERAGTAYLRQSGMALDLGGVAKLPILEAGMKTLQRHGVEYALINGGGDVLILGQLHGRAWRVGLRDPHAPERMLGMLELKGQAIVASSGDYERFFMANGERQHHILNPATGRPTHGPRGVSLLARDAASVNGLGTAIMVLGSKGAAKLLQNRPEVQAALVAERDHSVWQNPGHGSHAAACCLTNPWPRRGCAVTTGWPPAPRIRARALPRRGAVRRNFLQKRGPPASGPGCGAATCAAG